MSSHKLRYDTNAPAIYERQRDSREPPLIEFECGWAFRIRAVIISK